MRDDLLATLAAENAIRRLISAYCDAVNRLSADCAGKLFAPDAIIRIAHFPELSGRDAITEGMRQTFAATSFLRQQCDAGLIDADGNHARSRLSVIEATRRSREDSIGLIFGFYEDEYVRLEEGWRFHRRRYTMQLRSLLPADKLQEIPNFVPGFDFSA